jgi:phosphohistidine phosphatase
MRGAKAEVAFRARTRQSPRPTILRETDQTMRQLILLRHAKAVPADGRIQDFDRPLADQGRLDAPRVARALVAAGAAPELALVSDAKRTRETWEMASPAFPAARVQFLPEFYDSDAETLLEGALDSGAQSVIVIAHNPGLHELAGRLAHRNTPLDAALRSKLPPAGAALFERKDENSSWRLTAFVTPETAG